MSNYPPGVTGNEWQIAGQPEREVDLDEQLCDGCGERDQVGEITVFLDGEQWVGEWPCALCEHMNTYAEDVEQVPEPELWN